jgi:hypothetical protein
VTNAGGSLTRLVATMRSQGGLISTLLGEDAERRALAAEGKDGERRRGPAQIAAEGPRARVDPGEYELLVETIYEGYLLHYCASRLVSAPEADLALLAGDQLYALGLARLVQLGDLAAVAELADVITLCALAQGCGRPDLADLVWQAGARAIGWGGSASHARAKALTRAGSPEALTAMRAAAEATA